MKTLMCFAVATLTLLLVFSAAVSVLASGDSPSPSQIVFQDGFETYPTGDDLANYGWAKVGSPIAVATALTRYGLEIDSGPMATTYYGAIYPGADYTRMLAAPAQIGAGGTISTTWVLYAESGVSSRNEIMVGVRNAAGSQWSLSFRHDRAAEPATSFWDIYLPGGGWQRIYDDGVGGVKEGKIVVTQTGAEFYKRVYGAPNWSLLYTSNLGSSDIAGVNMYLWASNWAPPEDPWWEKPYLDSIVMYSNAPVPEPGSLAALLTGLSGLAGVVLTWG
jgi:hypothetical protein